MKKEIILPISIILLISIIILIYYKWIKKPLIQYTEQQTATGEKQYLLTYNYREFERFPYNFIYANANELERNKISVLVSQSTFEKIKTDNKFKLVQA